MADHFISFDKADGLSPANLTTGTTSASTEGVELRILDGAGLTQTDVILAIKGLKPISLRTV